MSIKPNPYERLKRIGDGGPVVFVKREIAGLLRSSEGHMKRMCRELAAAHELTIDPEPETSLEMAEKIIQEYDSEHSQERMEELIDMGNRYIRINRFWGLWYLVWSVLMPLGLTALGYDNDTPIVSLIIVCIILSAFGSGMAMFGSVIILKLINIFAPGYDYIRLLDSAQLIDADESSEGEEA